MHFNHEGFRFQDCRSTEVLCGFVEGSADQEKKDYPHLV